MRSCFFMCLLSPLRLLSLPELGLSPAQASPATPPSSACHRPQALPIAGPSSACCRPHARLHGHGAIHRERLDHDAHLSHDSSMASALARARLHGQSLAMEGGGATAYRDIESQCPDRKSKLGLHSRLT
jgi:hypothetical protein